MKKKIFSLIFIISICLLVTGCQGNITRGIRHAGFSIAGEFVCDFFVVKDEESLYFNKMKFLTSSFIVSENGDVYEISLGKQYSNKQNCQKSAFNKRVKGLFDNKVARADDGKFYYIAPDNNVILYSEVTVADNSYEIYDLLLKEEDVVKVVTVDKNSGIYYLLKTDGNIYKYVLSRADTKSPYKIDLKEVLYSSGTYGFITDFNFSYNSIMTNYIMTDTSLYRMKVVNLEACNSFADVTCKYEMGNDVGLLEYKKYISGFNGSMLITNYGKVFNVAN